MKIPDYIHPSKPRPILDQQLVVRSVAICQQGRHSQINQDAVFHWSSRTDTGQALGVYLVCDGMGGHESGELASRLAVDTISAELVSLLGTLNAVTSRRHTRLSPAKMAEWIRMIISKANSRIYHQAEYNSQETHMGTTLTLAVVYDTTVQVANVGDSRVYHWHAPYLTQITSDHSMVAKLVQDGVITESEQATHPRSNIIFRALGIAETVEVDLFSFEIASGDRVLLCSDGLWKAFPNSHELRDLFDSSASPAELAQQLITDASRRTVTDDCSLIVVSVR